MKFASRLALTAVLVIAGLSAPARAAEPDPLLPKETTSIIYVNFRQVLDSGLVKKYAMEQMKQAMEGEGAQQVLKELGLDPLKDIDRLTIGLWGKGAEDMNFAGVVRGKFDPAKLFKAVEAEAKKNPDKVKLVKNGKYTLIKAVNENAQPGQPKEVYGAVADEKTIVIGSSEKNVIDSLARSEAGTTKSEMSNAMTKLMLKMDEKSTIYMCGLNTSKEVPQLPPQLGQVFDDPEKLAKQLANIETISFILNVTEDISVEIAAGMKDTDAATEMGGMMEDLVGKAKAFLPFIGSSQPQMKPLTSEIGKTLKAKSKDKDVVISLKISGKSIGAATGKDDQ
ncbi:MAG: hypothetical protein U0798_00335 [Gemmataceae bacterium]